MADPDLSPGPLAPSVLRRPGCWVAFVSLIPMLIGLVYVAQNWFGGRALSRAQRAVAAAGIELDPLKVPSTRPPDEENFWATPLLMALATGAPSSAEWDAIRRLGSWHGIAGVAGARMQSSRHPGRTNWAAVRDAITRGDPEAALDPNESPTNALSMSLAVDLGPARSELRSVLDRPHSAVVPSYLDHVRSGRHGYAGGAWMSDLRALAKAVALDAAITLEGAAPVNGIKDIRVLLKLAEGAENYGGIVAFVVGGSVRAIAHELVWSAAARRELSASHWRELSALFYSQHPLDRLSSALATETLFAHLAFGEFRHSPASALLAGVPVSSGAIPWMDFASWLPRGWFDANEAVVLEAYAELSLRSQEVSRPDRFVPRLDGIDRHGFPWHNTVAGELIPATSSLLPQAASAEAIGQLAATACALEACFAESQSYPAELEALVPAFLPAVPLDLDGQAVRYQPEPTNQRYRLWSIGVDGRDDGGMEKSERGSKPVSWSEPVGDWLWHYPP